MKPESILVVGASSDLGIALARRLLETTEYPLIAHHHSGGARLDALGDARWGQERIVRVGCDLSNIQAVGDMATGLVAQHGVPSSVVWLPGLPLRYERFTKFDLDHFDRDLTIQVRSAAAFLKVIAPSMSKLGRSRVIFVGSSVTRALPPKFLSMYTTVKYAQLGLARSLAAEYAATPLTVNVVSPSMIQTRFLDGVPELVKEMAAQSSPRGRLATPADVIGAIEWLLSPGADFVTGVDVPVAGGGAC